MMQLPTPVGRRVVPVIVHEPEFTEYVGVPPVDPPDMRRLKSEPYLVDVVVIVIADCDALLKVKVCAVLVDSAYVESAAIVTVTLQVPSVEADRVAVAKFVSERVQPVAVPFVTA